MIVLDVTDQAFPVSFNILQQGSARAVVEELCTLFDILYRDSTGVWTRKVMYHGLRTLATDPISTLVDLAPLLSPTAQQVDWRDTRTREVSDREIKQFWQEFDALGKAEQERYVRPVMDRVWQLTSRPEILNIIGQSRSLFDLLDVITGNKILLVNLAGLPKDTASLTGTLIMNTIWRAVRSGRGQRPNFLYLDEFQTFVNLPVDAQELFAQARSFGLGMVVAHQHLRQLPADLEAAVMANTATKLVFQVSARDAVSLSREFGKALDERDFVYLKKHHAIARVVGSDGMSQPVTVATTRPSPRLGTAAEVLAWSGRRYARPIKTSTPSLMLATWSRSEPS